MSERYPRAGTVLLGKYRVESVVGEGGMGAVVKAWHLDLEEPIALKILLPDMMDRPEIVTRFTREAKSAVKLKGEHVARVLDVGKLEPDADGNFDGTPYIAMEYLEGADLNQIIGTHGPQDAVLAVDLMLQACEAIAEAHALGIIHRDIKSSNFFITQAEDQPPHLKVLDFGIATPPKGVSDLTDGESVIGTPSYMAPEQMRSSRQADTRSDIWSMGIVLYEMLEGHKPFRAEAYSDLCLKVGMDPPDPMVQPNTPQELCAVVMKCLEKSVERRYQSVAELAFDLLPFASNPVSARASVETTARSLSRRGTRAFDTARAPDDVTPGAAPRITPVRSPTPAPGIPIFDPAAPLTPTSNGQMSLTGSELKPKRTGLVVVGSFFVAAAFAGAIALLVGGKKSEPHVVPRPAPEPSQVDMTPVAQPVIETPSVGSAGATTTSSTPVTPGSAAEAGSAATGSAAAGSAATGSATESVDAGSASGSATATNTGSGGRATTPKKVIKKRGRRW